MIVLDVEVAHVLRRFVMASGLTEARAREAIEDHRALGICRYPHDFLLDRVWQSRGNGTAYDVAYLVLSEALDAPLITCDVKLTVIPGASACVAVIGA